MLHYHIHDGPVAFRFALSGILAEPDTQRLEQDRQTALSTLGPRTLVVDVSDVTGVDEAGRMLLRGWHEGGARLVANSEVGRRIAESITGVAIAPPAARAQKARWRLPRMFRFGLAAGLLLVAVSLARGAELEPRTLHAWERYVHTATARVDESLRNGNAFLWVDQDPERLRAVQSGQVLTTPVSEHEPFRVPGGLIHDWRGAAFLAGTNLDEVIDVLRDYERYPEFFGPSVVGTSRAQRGVGEDRFSLVLMNRAFFLKTALSGDYRSSYVRLDNRREYGITQATSMREIEDYGGPDQHILPEGRGSGYIWRLFSVSKLEQRDGGVYVEVEAIALSRNIPFSVRWLVDPIVRRVSRSALLTSLRQTRAAVSTSLAAKARELGEPKAPDNPCASHAACTSGPVVQSFR